MSTKPPHIVPQQYFRTNISHPTKQEKNYQCCKCFRTEILKSMRVLHGISGKIYLAICRMPPPIQQSQNGCFNRKSLQNQLVMTATQRSSCVLTGLLADPVASAPSEPPEAPHHDVCLVKDRGQDLCNRRFQLCCAGSNPSLLLYIYSSDQLKLNVDDMCSMKLQKSLIIWVLIEIKLPI